MFVQRIRRGLALAADHRDDFIGKTQISPEAGKASALYPNELTTKAGSIYSVTVIQRTFRNPLLVEVYISIIVLEPGNGVAKPLNKSKQNLCFQVQL
jgi:hypothetical protein